VQRYVRELLEALRSQDRHFELAVPTSQRKLSQHLWLHVALPWQARQADVLFCPANLCPVVLPSTIRLVLTLHCLRFCNVPASYRRSFRAYYRLLVGRNLSRARAVITVSHAQAEEILRRYPESAGRVHVVPPGVSPSFVPPAKPDRQKAFLFVGDLSPAKNLPLLLRAFGRVGEKLDHELWIVGQPSPVARLSADLRPLLAGLGNRVRWFGQINDTDRLVELYQRAEALVFPSRYESFGLPALEAMACGLPVLAAHIPGLSETLGPAGLLAEPDNEDDLVAKMVRLAEDARLREDLREAGLRRAKDFSWARCAQATWKVLTDAAG